jgi:hypothetical protein
MSGSRVNEGIQVFGGKVDIQNAAVGRNARTLVVTPEVSRALEHKGMDDIETRLRELESALAEHASRLPDVESTRRVASRIAGELTKPKPDRPTVLGALREIADGAKSVAGIMTAVEALKAAVAIFL